MSGLLDGVDLDDRISLGGKLQRIVDQIGKNLP